MSRSSVEIVACPNCGTQSEFTIYQSVNVTLEPKLKQEIPDFELFRFNCPSCQVSSFVFYETLYHDMERQVMLYFVPELNDSEEKKLNVVNTFNTMKEIDKENFSDSMNRYTLRMTSSIESFIEKIEIFEAGFDDRIIELMKFLLAPVEDEIVQFDYEHMLFTRADKNEYQFIFVNENRIVATFKFAKDYYEKMKQEYLSALDNPYLVDEEWAYQVFAQS